MEKRLFILSNRLPVSIDEEKGIQPSSGGLVTAINSYVSEVNETYDEIFWAGVPGCTVSEWDDLAAELETTHFNYLPVFVPPSDYEGYYNGFSNSVIWPLFHYFPSYAEYDEETYAQYQSVNSFFCDTLAKHLRPQDTVWIHDYHLLPLAALLRKEIPELTIGFFLHIPFPSYELFRLLPRQWQQDMLKGMLGADLIGFHTIDYAAHFLQSIQLILGLDNDHHLIHYDDRLIKVDVFPISIDYEKFNESFNDPIVVSRREILRNQMGQGQLIFSVDRLDYTKGVHNRLKAYEYFLKQNPEFIGKVIFILVIVPSRDTITKYAERKRMIDETVSRLNSAVGTIDWQPVIYQYNNLSFDEMVALYTACDLALITPLRDGMNLVSKEFVASRADEQGVLIISEMAGAARELTDALTINPNDIKEMAQKIKEGLTMELSDQQQRMVNMRRRVQQYDVRTWATEFIDAVHKIKALQASYHVQFLDSFSRGDVIDKYRRAKKRLLLLDYDGTLVSFAAKPESAVPSQRVLDMVKQLSTPVENDLFIISGRSSSWLEQHFGHLPANLIAEHGARYRFYPYDWVSDMNAQQEWKDGVRAIMEAYTRRCAGSFVEEKDFSMVWHYRNAAPEQGRVRSFELTNELKDFTHHRQLQVLVGNRIVEVRHSGIDKGSFLQRLLKTQDYDFIFAVGDDRTDEDMFRTLVGNPYACTIKVGAEASYAQYNLHTPQMVVALLESLGRLSLSNPVP